MGKFILLTKDIQTVLVKLDRNKDKTVDIFDDSQQKIQKIDHQFTVVKKYDLLQKSHLLELEILLYIEFIKLIIDKKKKNQALYQIKTNNEILKAMNPGPSGYSTRQQSQQQTWGYNKKP